MADIICRWRNGTPENIVELVNSMPHVKMTHKEFRNSMKDKWGGEFFTSPYQLACQLGLYCEAEDGFYYPRFDHDITRKEAELYLYHWMPRYYVPNPYVGKDGFNKIHCPTYVLKSLYDYLIEHPDTDYITAYHDIFKEEVKNNDDIMKNYINRYSKILHMDKTGKLTITDYNPQIIFGFMDRNDKKAFFDNFSLVGIVNPMKYYIDANLEQRKELFKNYLYTVKSLSDSTIKQYVNYHLITEDILNLIKKISGKDNLYEVISIADIQQIYNGCKDLQINKDRNNVFTAAVINYKDFINYLESEDAKSLFYDFNLGEKKSDYSIDATSNNVLFSIEKIIVLIKSTGLLYDDSLIKRFAFSLLSKQFLILSGLAGSGKTQLALAFAQALIHDKSQLCVVSVGADWTNREPLLGFPNALQENRYIRPESGVLDLLIEANKHKNKPYFLILDEMNMSYVERYFADFLSAMESGAEIPLWKGDDEKQAPKSIGLPRNLFIIGTINVDETTYMFSPKVLDRANVIEFKISMEEMRQFLDELKPVDRNSICCKAADMGTSFVRLAANRELASNTDEIKETLNNFFFNLKSVNAEFGYRSATEIFRFISQSLINDDTSKKLGINQILDFAIVQKLLPKLHGSRKKLEPVLQALWKLCFDGATGEMGISNLKVKDAKFPYTADKIQRMYDAAYSNGFTSFAEA